MGHRDTGKTACPGANLYSQLNTIRANVKAKIKKMNIAITPLIFVYRHPDIFTADSDKKTITLPYPLSQKMTQCSLITKDRITIDSCHHDGKKLTLSLSKADNKKSS